MSDHDQAPPPAGDGAPDWGEAKDKLMAATGADRVILIAGLVFFVDSFLPWYGVLGFNISGWNAGTLAVLSILAAIGATLFAAARVLGMSQPLGGLNDGVIYLGLGGAAFVLAVLRLLTESSLTKFGLFIAIIAGGVLAYGGWLKYQQSN